MTPLSGDRIGVLMGGVSSEREISLKSGEAILAALIRCGYQAIKILVDSEVDQKLREEKIQMVFLALHGSGGEDGLIQGLLETLKIPYTGSGVLASSLGMHKGSTKKMLFFHGIRTPKSFYWHRGEQERMPFLPPGFQFPLVVKPLNQGSTIGISLVQSSQDMPKALQEAGKFGSEVMIEEYIKGQELTVGILGETPLPVVEMLPVSEFYDYEAKYQKGKTEYLLPAPLEKSLYLELQQMALSVHQAIGCVGISRVDFRVDTKGTPFVLEINTIPGMTETSLFPKAAAHSGIAYDALVEKILESAIERKRAWG